MCGITGFKPTARRVPIDGVVPLSTLNWNSVWHGGSAMPSTSPGFHAETMSRRLSGFFWICAMMESIWFTERPSAVRQSVHCAP